MTIFIATSPNAFRLHDNRETAGESLAYAALGMAQGIDKQQDIHCTVFAGCRGRTFIFPTEETKGTDKRKDCNCISGINVATMLSKTM